jgi:hypothetical protein
VQDDTDWDVVDLLVLRPDGSLVCRESFFDPAPVARSLVLAPRSWWPWLRSGLRPFEGRRRLLDRLGRKPTSGAGQ